MQRASAALNRQNYYSLREIFVFFIVGFISKSLLSLMRTFVHSIKVALFLKTFKSYEELKLAILFNCPLYSLSSTCLGFDCMFSLYVS